jgi:(4-(4-[2-(gamma-L-glutamylamino)ethyl]phenoxymethyl)furan-2-yl)methanamine synthase
MIGIDVGGANVKLVDDDGVHLHYCPLWEGAPLTGLLQAHKKPGQDQAAVVMSGELADCFTGKMQGITFIVNAVKKIFPGARFYGMDGRFHQEPVPELAAANWLASADFLRDRYPSSILLDVGSTTADIIPLADFNGLTGLTDLKRLQKGYLLYTGMLRTPVATLISSVSLDGIQTALSTEYFASTADVHLVLNHITPADYVCDTAYKKEKTRAASMQRLAHVVCADLVEIGERGAMQIAEQCWDRQRTLICEQVQRVARDCGATGVIMAGIGAPLFARACGGKDLTQELGPGADALPAFAVREVARRSGLG